MSSFYVYETQYTIKDEILNRIGRQIDSQTDKGVKKYGHTLDECRYTEYDWLMMLNEELIDALQYANKEIRRLKGGNEMMQELTDQIRTWAIYRGLDEADPNKQMLKLGEEFGELCQAIAKDRKLGATKDAIGDMFVVLTILSMQLGTSVEECAALAYDEIKDRKGEMVNGVFVKESDL